MDQASLKYAKTHEWVALDGEIATIGITDFAVKQLTDLVFIDLPEVGRTISRGETFGEVESVKAVSDLYAPISGEIIEVNSDLENDLAKLSDDAFESGWLIRVRVDSSDLGHLMDLAEYQKHCAAEEH